MGLKKEGELGKKVKVGALSRKVRIGPRVLCSLTHIINFLCLSSVRSKACGGGAKTAAPMGCEDRIVRVAGGNCSSPGTREDKVGG